MEITNIKPQTNLFAPRVKLFYGPYESHGVVRHKRQRLDGLVKCLEERGFRVDLLPTRNYNRLEVVMLGREIYRVNIKYLLFNMEWREDMACLKTADRIIEATRRLYSSFNMSKACDHITRTEELPQRIF